MVPLKPTAASEDFFNAATTLGWYMYWISKSPSERVAFVLKARPTIIIPNVSILVGNCSKISFSVTSFWKEK